MSGLGTFADEMVSHEWSLVAVETDLPAEQLALIGCGVMTGVGSVLNTAKVEAGSTVAVIGLGGVGQSVVQAAAGRRSGPRDRHRPGGHEARHRLHAGCD